MCWKLFWATLSLLSPTVSRDFEGKQHISAAIYLLYEHVL